MAEVSRSISLNVLAKLEQFHSEISKLPGITEKAAARAALKMQGQFQKAETARLKQLEQNAKKTASSISRAFAGVMALESVASGARQLAATLQQWTQQLHDARNTINDLGAATGVANSTLSSLDFAARTSGGSIQELSSGIREFPKRLDDFARGTGEAQVALRSLGFTNAEVADALNRGENIMGEVVSRLQGVESATKKAALASQIFGESGVRLAQVLGSTGLEEWSQLAAKYGVSVGPAAAKASARWQAEQSLLSGALSKSFEELDNTVSLSQAFVAGNKLLVAVLAGLNKVVDIVLERLGLLGAIVRSIVERDFKNFEAGISRLAEIYTTDPFGLEAAQAAIDKYNELGEDLGKVGKAVVEGSGVIETRSVRTAAAVAQLAASFRDLGDVGAAMARIEQIISDMSSDTLGANEAIRASYAGLYAEIDTLSARGLVTHEEAEAARQAITERVNREIAASQRDAFMAGVAAAADASARIDEITGEMGSDTLRTNEAIRASYADLYREVDALAQQGLVSHGETEAARQAITERVNREIAKATREQVFRIVEDSVAAYGQLATQLLTMRADHLAEEAQLEAQTLSARRSRRQKLQAQLEELERETLSSGKTTSGELRKARVKDSIEALNAEIRSQRQRTQEARKAALNAWRLEKSAAIISIGIQALVAATRALAELGPIAGAFAAGGIAAGAAAAAAAVASQPAPSFFRGGKDHSRGGAYSATLHRDEAVLNARAVRRIGEDAVDALNRGESVSPVVTVMIDGRALSDAVVPRLRRAGDLRRAVTVAGKTGRRLVYG